MRVIGAILERNKVGFGLKIAKNSTLGPDPSWRGAASKPLTEIAFCNCGSDAADQFTVYKKKGVIKPSPFRIQKSVVLEPLTDPDQAAEFTVMPAVLSTAINCDALSLRAKGTY